MTHSQFTDKDKAAEYDRIADYLRAKGWSVFKTWKHPMTGELHESWYQGDVHSQSDLVHAYKMECFKDAPKQGERMTASLDKLVTEMDAKRAKKAVCEHRTLRSFDTCPAVYSCCACGEILQPAKVR